MNVLKLLVIFLSLLNHHETTAISENLNTDGEISEGSYEDSNSMEELTTIPTYNEASLFYEAKPPVQIQSSGVLDIINQTSSPLLMKLMSPIEKQEEIILTTQASTEFFKKLNDTEISTAITEQNVITQTSVAKRPRLLMTKARKAENNDNSMEDTTITDVETENIEVDEEITTLIPPQTLQPTSKRPPKNIEIFKTRPNELLRFYVEDGHLRSPIAALVDKKSNPLIKAKKLWKAALRPNSLLDIMVVSYDSEGIKSTYNLTNTKAMMTTLDKVREENVTDNESKTYYSIIRTGQLIPFDSAIFLSTDDLPNDTEHQLQASMFLLKKRIRLYLILFDDKNLSTNETSHASVKETGYLGRLAMLSGGDIIYVPNYAFQNQVDGEMGYITLIRRNKLKEIDQDPLKEVNENELRNDTETLSAKDEQDDSISNI